MTQELQSFTSFIEEGFVVKYHDKKGEHKNTSRVFTDKAKADAHASKGNSIDKVGGKYTVHKIDDEGRDVKEEVELDEAKSPQQKADFDRMMAGAMSRAAYNAKWKKPLKSDDKVIYGKNVKEELKGDQHKIDKNKNGKLDAHDFKLLRKEDADLVEEESLEESMTDSWKRVQSMDKGSITGGKDDVRKRLAYLSAVHAHHKKYGNDTKKVKSEIEKINRSKIAEEVVDEQAPVAPVPGDKWKDHAVMVHKDSKQRVVIQRANKKNYPEHEGWKEVSPGQKMKEDLDEEMSDEQKAKREKIVKGMKKSYADFKARYGSRAKEVMYATATKKAMGEAADCDYDDKDDMKENAFDWKNNTNKSSGKFDVKQVGNRTVVTRKYNPETGHSTGTDDDEKPAEKRGRGRPAGSKSGAKQKGSGKSNDYRGIATHSLNLPNTK